MLDLQQQHTSLIDHTRISQRVQTTVISYYPGRGENGVDEALIDAGVIAFSKDSGPSGGYGDVIGLPWKLSRMSQEHGILTPTEPNASPLELGKTISIVGQHACLIAAVSNSGFDDVLSKNWTIAKAYPWYYIVDSDVGGGREVVDIWVPWKGWWMPAPRVTQLLFWLESNWNRICSGKICCPYRPILEK